MKKLIGAVSLTAAAVLYSGCGDTGDTNVTNTTVEAQSFSISGDVKGCVVDTAGDPVKGAKVSLGNVNGVTDADGCYALNIKIVTMNSHDSAATQFADQTVLVTHERFLDTTRSFRPTENVIAGVIYDFGEYHLDTDLAAPNDQGIIDAPYANNMLLEGINGRSKPFELQLSEYVDLADTISQDTIITLKDETGQDVSSTTTATVRFDGGTNILSVTTSESISAGYYVTVRIPAAAITDVNGNTITSGTDAQVLSYGPSATDYLTFTVRVYLQSDATINPVTNLSQMDKDSGLLEGETYDEALSALETVNASFNNLVKSDATSVNARRIYNYNQGGTLTASRMADLADAYISDPTVSSVSVTPNTVRVKFTPSSADHYEVKVLNENNNSVNINLIETTNATATINSTIVTLKDTTALDVELALSNIDANSMARLVVTPFGASGTPGDATYLDLKDNVKPTTSLQYSYQYNDADTNSTVTTSGGVITAKIYGGSGELSNPDGNSTDPQTVYKIGTPYLEMYPQLLSDQNVTTADTGKNFLPSSYTAADYTAWVADANSSRSFGVGFTEAINISGKARLTRANGTSADTLITDTVNTQDNQAVISSVYRSEDIAIVSVSNIHTLVNEHNGSILDLTAVTTDLSGNSAAVAQVILVDKVPPYIVQADINASDLSGSTITFNENVAPGSLTIDNTVCNIPDTNITAMTVTLDSCGNLTQNPTASIVFSNMPDLNGNQGTPNNFETEVK